MRKKKIKVAVVYLSNYKNWPLGGMLSYVRNLMPYLGRNEWKVDYWGCGVDGNYLSEVNIKTQKYPIKPYTNVKTTKKIIPNFVRSFFSIIRSAKLFAEYDVIYSHTAATTIGLKIMHPKKFVVHHQHGLSYVDNHGFTRFLNLGYILAQKLADVSFFVASECEVDEYKRKYSFFSDKAFYSIGSPIETREIELIEGKKEDEEVFIYTGRLTKWKNVDFIVEAFSKYLNFSKNSKLMIIGNGDQYDILSEKIKTYSLENNVFLLGELHQEDVFMQLKSSVVFLFASKGEGVSVSILEALAAGIPVVACDVIGVRNLVKNGITGFLVSEFNIDDYVDAMKKAVKNGKMMRQSCIEFARKYDSLLISDEIEKIINYEYKS